VPESRCSLSFTPQPSSVNGTFGILRCTTCGLEFPWRLRKLDQCFASGISRTAHFRTVYQPT